MRHSDSPACWLVPAVGIAALVWSMCAASAERFVLGAETGARTRQEPVPASAAEGRTAKKPNLSLWVPEEELRVWDPVNPNINPIPWRVFGLIPEEGKRTAAFRHTAIDQRVRVEGLAWGYDVETDLPTSRVVFEGGTILVKGVDFHRDDVLGKTVRVEGVLRLEWLPQRGFERQFPRYYCLDAEGFEVIERVTDPRVVLSP